MRPLTAMRPAELPFPLPSPSLSNLVTCMVPELRDESSEPQVCSSYCGLDQHHNTHDHTHKDYNSPNGCSPGIPVLRWSDNTKKSEVGLNIEMKSLDPFPEDTPFRDFVPFLSSILAQASEDTLRSKRSSRAIKTLTFKDLKNEPYVRTGEGFSLAISVRDATTIYMSNTVTSLLGYPKDMILGQCFLNFLYPMDRIPFAGYMTKTINSQLYETTNVGNFDGDSSFFCRIREYQGLKFGYGLAMKRCNYKAFRVTVHFKNVLLEEACVEDVHKSLCLVTGAVLVGSAYKVPDEIPAMSPFSTRHTASCHFSHIDASAVPYIGYLPQDLVGKSIFDYYHMDDLPMLKEVYELVVKEKGSSFRSNPYRFRVQNGHYIVLETEWSCFINPWSKKIEFILGQHRVLKGPGDPNVFNINDETTSSEELSEEIKRIEGEIISILSLPVKDCRGDSLKPQACRRKCRLAAFVSGLVDELAQKQQKENSVKNKEECSCRSSDGSVVMGEISPHQEFADSDPSTETPPSSQEIQYQENIERFFASHPKTYSSTASGESKSEERNTPNISVDGSEAGKNSGCSEEKDGTSQSAGYGTGCNSNGSDGSTMSKRKMSSVITGDSGKSSFNTKDGMQPAEASNSSSSGGGSGGGSLENYPPCLALTEEVLSQHNRLTHKYLKQRKGKISNTNSTPKKDCHRLKRSSSVQSPDLPNAYRKHKHSKQHEGGISVATTTTQTEDVKFSPLQSSSLPMAAFSLSPPFSLGLPVMTQPPPVVSTSTQTVPKTPTYESSVYSSPIANFAVPAYTYMPPASSTAANPGPFFVPVMYMGALPLYPSIPQMIPQSAGHSICHCGTAPQGPSSCCLRADITTTSCSTKTASPTLESIQKMDRTNPSTFRHQACRSNIPSPERMSPEQCDPSPTSPSSPQNVSMHENDTFSEQDELEKPSSKINIDHSDNHMLSSADTTHHLKQQQHEFITRLSEEERRGQAGQDCEKDILDDSVSLSFASSLLKSDGFSNRSQSDSAEEMEPESKESFKGDCHPIRSQPSWMEGINMNPNIIFCYQIQTKSMEEVLKKDLEALKFMQQSDLVNEQLAALQSELEEMDNHFLSDMNSKCLEETMNLGFATLEDDVGNGLAAAEENTLHLIEGDI